MFDAADDAGPGGRMSFLQHLDELRKRLIWALVSVRLGFGVTIFFGTNIFQFIMRPMQQLLPAGQKMIYTDPGEAFGLEIKVALIAGLIIASPMVSAQMCLFVAPGLYSHEKKWALPFIAMSSFFFVVGAAFAHYVVFPIVWMFFVNFTNDFMTFMPRVEPAFSMYLRLVLALGFTFQLPTLVLFLARMGMITPGIALRAQHRPGLGLWQEAARRAAIRASPRVHRHGGLGPAEMSEAALAKARGLSRDVA